jgi:hypothetical protein
MSTDQLPLDKVLDPFNFKKLLYEVIKTREPIGDGRSFSYKEIKYPHKDKVFYVTGRHFPLEEVLKNGNSSCNVCYSKGYYFSEIAKKKFPDPSEFLVQEDLLPKDLTPIEQQKWEEREKNKTTWVIMTICGCAVKRTHKKNPKVLSNAQHNIWMTLDYEIKDD